MNRLIVKIASIGLSLFITSEIKSPAYAYDFDFKFDDGDSSRVIMGTIFDLNDNQSGQTSSADGISAIVNKAPNLPLGNYTIFTSGGGVSVTGLNVSPENFYLRHTSNQILDFSNKFGNGESLGTQFTNLATFSLVSPTPVPFDVSSGLSIFILGGIFGAMRLCKTLETRSNKIEKLI